MAVALDRHHVAELYTAVAGNSAHVVAAQIDQHGVLGALLWIGAQLVLEALIFGEGRAARPRAGDGAHRHPLTIHAYEQLGRAAHELHAIEHEVVHVRRRVQGAQCPV